MVPIAAPKTAYNLTHSTISTVIEKSITVAINEDAWAFMKADFTIDVKEEINAE
ncbi:hypothetical protein [Sediminibacterium salmoneum]|uniref:hypothetical protein n=1 Tax=Sediminibacterium salmoneum TaxID=426421 RepID=UPI001FE0095C|nr:hypothetical protein [Sediminibacterium salmoneum]